MNKEKELAMEAIVKTWVNNYINLRVPEAWAAAYTERVGAANDNARPPDAWWFHCNCTHIWDDGGEPPKWDAMVEIAYEDDILGAWAAEFNPEFTWIPPYPTYGAILDPSSPGVYLEQDTDNTATYLLGPDVLDLQALLDKAGVRLLAEEGTGGDTDITVTVDAHRTATVVINIRALPGKDAVCHEFRWTLAAQGA